MEDAKVNTTMILKKSVIFAKEKKIQYEIFVVSFCPSLLFSGSPVRQPHTIKVCLGSAPMVERVVLVRIARSMIDFFNAYASQGLF